MNPITSDAGKRIINNVVNVINSDNVDLLTPASYQFLSLVCGFIAHYNLQGFKETYRNTDKLRRDVLENKSSNQWDNFSPKDRDYNYYMSKKNIYNNICNNI